MGNYKPRGLSTSLFAKKWEQSQKIKQNCIKFSFIFVIQLINICHICIMFYVLGIQVEQNLESKAEVK